MIKKTFIIIDPEGLSAGPVGLFCKEAASFASSVLMECGKKRGNAKSMMSVMEMDLDANERFELLIEGPDQEEALTSIEKVMKECGIV